MTIEVLAKQGNGVNSGTMAESILTRVYDLRKKAIKDSFQNFQQQEHRLEFVAKICGVEFINDSMACNINSTWYALENMHSSTIWIVGGQTKDTDFTLLQNLVKKKVKAIICLGLDNTPIVEAFMDTVPNLIQTQSAQEAVERAYFMATEGDTVLLSPACPSFDLFESFEDRGRQFKLAVNEL